MQPATVPLAGMRSRPSRRETLVLLENGGSARRAISAKVSSGSVATRPSIRSRIAWFGIFSRGQRRRALSVLRLRPMARAVARIEWPSRTCWSASSYRRTRARRAQVPHSRGIDPAHTAHVVGAGPCAGASSTMPDGPWAGRRLSGLLCVPGVYITDAARVPCCLGYPRKSLLISNFRKRSATPQRPLTAETGVRIPVAVLVKALQIAGFSRFWRPRAATGAAMSCPQARGAASMHLFRL